VTIAFGDAVALANPAMKALQARVPTACAAGPLLDWLVSRFRYFDADGWRTALRAGALTKNGVAADEHTLVRGGDAIGYQPPVDTIAPVQIAVLHCDDDLLVVDKPAWLVVQADTAFPAHSLPFHLRRQFSLGSERILEPAHRLDRETSGVLVFTRNLAAARHCQRQFEAGAVHKRYLALVRGEVTWTKQRVDAPIGPRPDSALPHRRGVLAKGAPGARQASSEFTVIERLAGATLLRAVPHSGRTHQLRCHLEHLGHPLIGDTLYGTTEDEALAAVAARKAGRRPTTRHLLHAAELHLPGPNGAQHRFAAPTPPDFAAAIAARRPPP
jgi:RluA family pseudouridine synthase